MPDSGPIKGTDVLTLCVLSPAAEMRHSAANAILAKNLNDPHDAWLSLVFVGISYSAVLLAQAPGRRELGDGIIGEAAH